MYKPTKKKVPYIVMSRYNGPTKEKLSLYRFVTGHYAEEEEA